MRNQVDVDFKKNSHTRGASIHVVHVLYISWKPVKESIAESCFLLAISTDSVTYITYTPFTVEY